MAQCREFLAMSSWDYSTYIKLHKNFNKFFLIIFRKLGGFENLKFFNIIFACKVQQDGYLKWTVFAFSFRS